MLGERIQPKAARSRPARMALLALVFLGGAALIALLHGPAAAAATFTVDRTGDAADIDLANGRCDSSSSTGDQCTLRAAIEEANDTSGADKIRFSIGDTDTVKTIMPDSGLPTVTEQVTINGYSQRGAGENTLEQGNDAVLKVQLNGTDAGTASGLTLTASDSIIKGLVINRFDLNGIIVSGDAADNVIRGNFLGTNVAGTTDLGNGSNGVSISGISSDNTIGGTQPARRNLISGNNRSGISSGGTGNRVEGNFIGTTADGTGDLGNGNQGVAVVGIDSTVGGTDPAAGNVISGNGNYGVLINGSDAVGNSVLSNSVFANDNLGIELFNDGVTPNDTDDLDTGTNNFQNFPLISSASRSTVTGFTRIVGTLDSTPSQDFLIQCFLTEEGGDPSEHGEGAVLLDTTTRTTNSFGGVNFQCDSQIPEEGQTVSATATNIATGDTSEFSANETVLEP